MPVKTNMKTIIDYILLIFVAIPLITMGIIMMMIPELFLAIFFLSLGIIPVFLGIKLAGLKVKSSNNQRHSLSKNPSKRQNSRLKNTTYPLKKKSKTVNFPM